MGVKAKERSTGRVLPVLVEPLPPDVPARFLKPPAEPPPVEHVTAYLAFDLSGSMSGAPLAEAKKAAQGFLNNTDLAHCSLGIIAFSDTVKTKLEACQNAGKIEDAISGLDACETGVCNDGHPFDEVFRLLHGGRGARFAVVLADGVWSNQSLAITQAKACHQAGIDVISIGFGSADQKFLREIASSDEGAFFTSMGGLVETFTNIAQVITDTGVSTPVGAERKESRLGFFRRR